MAGEDTSQLYTPAHHSGQLDQRLNSTNYIHPQETNLLNLAKAMEYNSQGQPVIRTTSGAAITANDAFGRLRVSNPYTVFDSFHRYQDNGKFCQYTANGGTSTHQSYSSSVLMNVTTQSGSLVYRESNRVFPYQPGKSLQILQTFCWGPAKTNLRQRQGYFDVNNGIFLERVGNEISFNIRSTSLNGTPQITERILQSNWNVDPLNGTGISTLTLDLSTTQILFIDIQWLGVGTVRVGFVINGEFVTVHIFEHANLAGQTTTYMGTACLPVRVEIENLGTTESSSTLRDICSSVVSEGGYELKGRPLSAGHLVSSPYQLATNGVLYPVLSIRLKSTRAGGIVVPKNFSIGVDSAANFRYTIVVGGTTTGGSWIDAGSSTSSVEYNLTGTSFTGGTIVEMAYILSSNQSSSAPSLEDYPFKYQLERNTFTGEMYEFTICVVTTSSNKPNVYCSVNWEEVT